MITNVGLGALGSLVAIWLTWLWGRGLGAWQAWQARPSAQAQQESDQEAARRVAGNTQRLTILIGSVLILLAGFGALVGFLLLLVWTAENGINLLVSMATGLLLGMALTSWFALKRIDQVHTAIVEEERQRLSQLN